MTVKVLILYLKVIMSNNIVMTILLQFFLSNNIVIAD